MKVIALTIALLLAPAAAFADPTVTVTVAYPPSATVSGISQDDVESGLADRLVNEALRLVRCATKGLKYPYPKCAQD